MPDVPRRFNTAGPCEPARHYMLPPLDRLPGTRPLVDYGDYFVIHAARQSGKTTFLRAFASSINADGRFYALYCSLESLQGVEDADRAMAQAVDVLHGACRDSGCPPLARYRPVEEPRTAATVVQSAVGRLCRSLDKPLVIFFDEADCLSGQPAITFLRQLRNGFITRSTAPFPWSLALVGMRDIRDFKARVRPDSQALGLASPFNIVSETLTLANFTPDEVGRLYRQHTEATGQVFEAAAVERAWWWTEGQPWLVNAIARQTVGEPPEGPGARAVTAARVDAAADTIGKRRDTHIDSLLERLREPRVRKIMEPVLTGGSGEVNWFDDDTRYCFDLGLVTHERTDRAGYPGGIRPANPIYRDVMVRTLNNHTQMGLPDGLANRWMDGGRMDMTGLLVEFQRFWRENSEIWIGRYQYREAAPHLILQAFLQRVVNGGARIDREFSLGRRRVDLCVGYGVNKYPVELKLAGPGAREEGLGQLAAYMGLCGAPEGWLVIFDRDPDKPWDAKIHWATVNGPDGKTMHVVGC